MRSSRASRAIASAVALSASLLLWQPPAGAQTFDLEIQRAGNGFGTVHSIPIEAAECDIGWAGSCTSGGYIANSTIALAAVPDAGSVFEGWSGACTGTAMCLITMDADKTVTATMNARPGTNYLTVSARSVDGIAAGSVVSSPAGIRCATPWGDCLMNLPSQSVVTLTASPAAGAKASWAFDCSGTGMCQVSMDAQRHVGARFELQSPDSLNFTALWWDPTEPGWGINLNHQGDVMFATLFAYDDSRAPLWLVMPAGRRPGGDGHFVFSGDLFRTTGSAFDAVPVVPNTEANATKVGTMALTFTGFDRAELTYFASGRYVTKTIRRQVFGSAAADCRPTTASRASAANYQDLWWNPAESGWGINIAHQGDILFATLFTYDSAGRPLWLVMSEGRRQADGSFFGELYRTTGPPFDAFPWTDVRPQDITTVGTMRLRFSDGDHGLLTYSYAGSRTVVKSITRQVFSSPMPTCD